jgi:hypothetical protein
MITPAPRKADARDDIGGDLHRADIGVQTRADRNKGRRADRDEHIGAQTGAALPILAFGADHRAEKKGDAEGDG